MSDALMDVTEAMARAIKHTISHLTSISLHELDPSDRQHG